MKPASHFIIVLITAPDLKTARTLTKAALQSRLVACANLIPKVESHYWWRGKIQTGAEVMLVLKTARAKAGALEKFIRTRHPYQTPEFLMFPLVSASKNYLNWLAASVK